MVTTANPRLHDFLIQETKEVWHCPTQGARSHSLLGRSPKLEEQEQSPGHSPERGEEATHVWALGGSVQLVPSVKFL